MTREDFPLASRGKALTKDVHWQAQAIPTSKASSGLQANIQTLSTHVLSDPCGLSTMTETEGGREEEEGGS
jgi:hypothetical protein